MAIDLKDFLARWPEDTFSSYLIRIFDSQAKPESRTSRHRLDGRFRTRLQANSPRVSPYGYRRSSSYHGDGVGQLPR